MGRGGLGVLGSDEAVCGRDEVARGGGARVLRGVVAKVADEHVAHAGYVRGVRLVEGVHVVDDGRLDKAAQPRDGDVARACEHVDARRRVCGVREQLQRIAGIDHPVRVRELDGGLLRWRTRSRLAVDQQGRPGFRAHRSHRVIPIEDCPITVGGALDEVLERTWPSKAELQVTKDADGVVHVAEQRPDKGRPAKGRPGRRPKPAFRQVRGSGSAREQANGRSWQVSANGFWQVHPAAADAFAATVRAMADAPAGGVAWDLYGGGGGFAGGGFVQHRPVPGEPLAAQLDQAGTGGWRRRHHQLRRAGGILQMLGTRLATHHLPAAQTQAEHDQASPEQPPAAPDLTLLRRRR